MRVHHLNCGTMGSPDLPIVCHVLLVEADHGLVLVDTGFGLQDVADPARRLGVVRHLLGPAFNPEETAARQVDRLGFRRDDVRDIVVTHFDLDHIGGLADFPGARVHVTGAEIHGAVRSPSWSEKARYRPVQWRHGPHLVEHEPTGEAWRGFPAARELDEITPGLVLIPFPGHSRGHAMVAVDAGHRWVLHAGDAFLHRATVEGGRVPARLRFQEALNAYDRGRVRDNHARLAELHHRGDPDLMLVCAHDPEHLKAARASA